MNHIYSSRLLPFNVLSMNQKKQHKFGGLSSTGARFMCSFAHCLKLTFFTKPVNKMIFNKYFLNYFYSPFLLWRIKYNPYTLPLSRMVFKNSKQSKILLCDFKYAYLIFPTVKRKWFKGTHHHLSFYYTLYIHSKVQTEVFP